MADNYAEEDTKMDKGTQKKELYLQKIIKSCGTKHPLNVCVIGMYGVGKSSFINTIAAALNGKCWREHAYIGDYDGTRGVTTFVQRFGKCCQEDSEEYAYVSLPTLFDLAGFPDDDCVSIEEILRIFFFGKLKQGAAIQEAIDYFKDHGVAGLKEKYSRSVRDGDVDKIDRIIFVASARENLPVKLIKCVLKAAQPTASSQESYTRSIPIFGVLTHAGPKEMETGRELEHKETEKGRELEQKTDKLEDKKLQFMRNLGIVSHRLLLCSNYCDDIDAGNRVESLLPEIDIPVLGFLVQVFDRNLQVINDYEIYSETPRSLSPQETSPSQPETPGSATDQHYKMLQMAIVSIVSLMLAFVLGYFTRN